MLLKSNDTQENMKNIEKVSQEELNELNELINTHGMNKGIAIFQQKQARTEQLIELNLGLNCFYQEGVYALYNAVREVIGDVDLGAKTQASGDKLPKFVTINLPDGSELKIPIGKIILPSFDDESYLDVHYDYSDVTLYITAVVRKKNEGKIEKIFKRAKHELENNSIYKGAAIKLCFDEDGDAIEPEFIDLSNVDESKILMSDSAKQALIPIISRIQNTEVCIEMGLDLKFGALMEGPYGTGKTLIAFLLAKIAIEYNWTFVYLEDCNYIADTLKIVKNYTKGKNGILLFTEDIDQAVRGKRGKKIQDIVNTLDGGDTKTLPIISIFTTNHIEVIEPTFLRGKRIGSLISLGPLDYATAEKFVNNLVIDKNGDSLMDGSDITPAVEALCGIVPAFASEVIDKAKAYMINRGARKISPEDIVISALSYKRQMEFATHKKYITEKTNIEEALSSVGKAMGLNCDNEETEQSED